MATAKRIIEIYSKTPPEMRARVLDMFGPRRQHSPKIVAALLAAWDGAAS